jgi:predicted Zn-dependent protease
MTASSPADASDSLFEQALGRYREGVPPEELIDDFLTITAQAPRQSAGWTCLAWLQLLLDRREEALRSARTAVRLSPQDPQARLNLSLAMLETGAKGVREQVDMVRRVLLMAPEVTAELRESVNDGLRRRPGWASLEKIRSWLEL